MKFIFDFDDTLFLNTAKFKKRMFAVLKKAGIQEEKAREIYKEKREKEFSLKKFIAHCFESEKISQKRITEIYQDIMAECDKYLDKNLLKIVQKAEKQNCFIVTNGDKDFQKDKIKRSGITKLFQAIYIVPKSKKIEIEKICKKTKTTEKIVFIENREHFFTNLNTKKYPNLDLILYDQDGPKKIKEYLKKENF